MPVYDLKDVERFVAGTVGPPGQRAFFLQARDAHTLVTVALEKQQVQVLAERLAGVLEHVAPDDSPAPGEPGAPEPDVDPLDTPFEEDFRTSAISLQWDENTRFFTIECFEHDPDEVAGLGDLDSPEQIPAEMAERIREENVLRVRLTPVAARAFTVRCLTLVQAGRPPCPICSGPLEADGHICPRANGYRR